jgi:hypothetical protein
MNKQTSLTGKNKSSGRWLIFAVILCFPSLGKSQADSGGFYNELETA